MGHLHALNNIHALLEEGFFGKQSSRADSVFYSALYQYGVTHFVVDEPMIWQMPRAHFIRDRLIVNKHEKHDDRRFQIQKVFEEHLPENYRVNDVFNDVSHVSDLLDALSVALHEGSSVLNLTPVPEPESLRGLMPYKLLVPLTSLLRGVIHESTVGPILKHEVDTTGLKRLEDLFMSDLFQTYSSAHLQLEDQSQPVSYALENIRQKAVMLRDRYVDSVRLARMSVSLVGIVPKLVDTTFGKLPGAIAESFSRLAQTFLDQKRRLVIYDGSQLSNDLTIQIIQKSMRAEVAPKIVKHRMDEYLKRFELELKSEQERSIDK